MNNKGESQIGMLLILAIALIVGVVLLQASAQEVGKSTNTVAIANQSLVTAASDGIGIHLTNMRSLSGVLVWNATGDEVVPADNYTITNNVLDPTTGGLAVNVSITSISAANNGVWTIDGTSQPTTYITDSGGRAIANIIILLFAVALVIVSIAPAARQKIFDM